MKSEEVVFTPRFHVVVVVAACAVATFIAAYLLLEVGASKGAAILGWFASFLPLIGLGYFLVRHEMRRVVIERGEFKFESAGSSPGKFRTFKKSDLRVVERGQNILLVEFNGSKVAVLRRSTTSEYLWNRLRECLGLDGVPSTQEERELPSNTYEFTSRRVSIIVLNTMIYVALIAVGLGVILRADLDKIIRVAVSAYLPVVGIAFVISRKDVVRLALSENEIEFDPLGAAAVVPGKRKRLSLEAVIFESRPDRIVIKSGESVVGIVRRNSTTKEKWEELLNDIGERVHAAPDLT